MNEHLSRQQRQKLDALIARNAKAREAAARKHAKNKKSIWKKLLAFFGRK